MIFEFIDKEFLRLINQRSFHLTILPPSATPYEKRKLSCKIRQYRYSIKHGGTISTKIKIALLKRAGILLDHKYYTSADLISFVQYYSTQSRVAQQDIIYVLEKWEINKTKNKGNT